MRAELSRLVIALKGVDARELSTTEYVWRYFASYQGRLEHLLAGYARMLQASGFSSSDMVLDIGSGFGLLSFAAEACGARRVLAIDNDEAFLAAGRRLARALGSSVEFRPMDARDVAGLAGEGITLALSSDVIEHLYDLQGHFAATRAALLSGGRYCASTSVSALHPRTAARFARVHWEAEHRDGSERTGAEAYFAQRLSMLREANPALRDGEARRLANTARGLAGADLVKVAAAGDMRLAGFSTTPWWDPNTADPTTGYRPDRLMNPFAARATMERAGFRAILLRPDVGTAPRTGVRLALRQARRRFNATAPLLPVFVLNPGFVLLGSLPA